MDDWFNFGSVDVSDPGQDYWNMDPIQPTYDTSYDNSYDWGDQTPTYDYSNYDYSYDGSYDNSTSDYDYNNPAFDSNTYGSYDNGPIMYDDEGNPMPAGYNENGEIVDYNGNVLQGGQGGTPYVTGGNQQPGQGGAGQRPGQGQGGYGQPQQQGQQQNKGLLGGLFGGGQGQGQGGGSDLFGTLGALALGGGLGYLLSNVLGGKASEAAGAPPTPISMPGSNLGAPQKLALGGVNPGMAMGASAAPAMGSTTTNLGRINPGTIQTINPQTLAPSTPGPVPGPVAPAMPAGQQIPLDQIRSMIGM